MALPTLAPEEFSQFFDAVHGRPDRRAEPFPWQKRLAQRVFSSGEGWPAALDVPTGAGKTTAIDVAVFHLALQADAGRARTAPVRIFFIVDRRLVVDDAYRRAKDIADALANAEAGILKRVADRLRCLAEPKGRPLSVVRLRGGMRRDPDWVRTPSQPTVIVSTVDQVGSRLLEPWFVWPVWTEPLSRVAIEKLLSHPSVLGLRAREARALGIAEIYRARRISNGKYVNVTRALPVTEQRPRTAHSPRGSSAAAGRIQGSAASSVARPPAKVEGV